MEKFSAHSNPEILTGLEGPRPRTVDDDIKARAVRRISDLIDDYDGPGLIAPGGYARSIFDASSEAYDAAKARTDVQIGETESNAELLEANRKDLADRKTKFQKIWALIDASEGTTLVDPSDEEALEEFDRAAFMADTLVEGIKARFSEVDRRLTEFEKIHEDQNKEIFPPYPDRQETYRRMGIIAVGALGVYLEGKGAALNSNLPPHNMIPGLLAEETSEYRNFISGRDLGIIPPFRNQNSER